MNRHARVYVYGTEGKEVAAIAFDPPSRTAPEGNPQRITDLVLGPTVQNGFVADKFGKAGRGVDGCCCCRITGEVRHNRKGTIRLPLDSRNCLTNNL